MFDCGEGCPSELSISELCAVDHLFFSHFHADHVSGFDTFLRCNYGRTDRPNHIWGPPNSCEILHHRFQGFWWNLAETGTWRIHSIEQDRVRTIRLENSELFSIGNPEEDSECQTIILETDAYTVEAMLLNHRGPSVAYLVKEKPRFNMNMSRLSELGLKPSSVDPQFEGEQ